jgi:enoyl-CoA hydratase/carnithine racemase
MSRLEEYAKRYEDGFVISRERGILLVRQHTEGGPARYAPGAHSCWGWANLFQEIGTDPENEIIIFTGTGDNWTLAGRSPHYGLGEQRTEEEKKERPDPSRLESPDVMWSLYESHVRMMENLLNIQVPTIAAVNGPAPTHSEHALASDITLCTEDTYFRDPHVILGIPPGDGLGMSFQELLGTKRAAYYLYTGDAMDSSSALAFGLVNEVLPREKLLTRAFEIAERIMETPRLSRRMTTQIVRRPWRRRLWEDSGFHNAHEQLGVALDARAAGTKAVERMTVMAERWEEALSGRDTGPPRLLLHGQVVVVGVAQEPP